MINANLKPSQNRIIGLRFKIHFLSEILDFKTTYFHKRAYKSKGVYKSGDKWVARLWFNQKFNYLRRYDTECEAYQARQKALKDTIISKEYLNL
ncbi:MAG: hypothetical protein ACLPWD_01140 [Methanobacterium sp.]